MVDATTDFDVLVGEITSCTLCSLSEKRTNAVPGEGSLTADIFFIGEGPGFYEDRDGRPFVGPSGKFLDELLASIGLDRKDVFITNMVKCRPPNNRDPFPGEMEACAKYLDAQIAAINTKVIVPLGRHALARWFPNESIGKLRAKPRRFGETVLFPLYHPAAALHNGGLRSTIVDDFRKLGELLKQPRPAAAAPSAVNEPPKPEPQSQQLPMF